MEQQEITAPRTEYTNTTALATRNHLVKNKNQIVFFYTQVMSNKNQIVFLYTQVMRNKNQIVFFYTQVINKKTKLFFFFNTQSDQQQKQLLLAHEVSCNSVVLLLRISRPVRVERAKRKWKLAGTFTCTRRKLATSRRLWSRGMWCARWRSAQQWRPRPWPVPSGSEKRSYWSYAWGDGGLVPRREHRRKILYTDPYWSLEFQPLLLLLLLLFPQQFFLTVSVHKNKSRNNNVHFVSQPDLPLPSPTSLPTTTSF